MARCGCPSFAATCTCALQINAATPSAEVLSLAGVGSGGAPWIISINISANPNNALHVEPDGLHLPYPRLATLAPGTFGGIWPDLAPTNGDPPRIYDVDPGFKNNAGWRANWCPANPQGTDPDYAVFGGGDGHLKGTPMSGDVVVVQGTGSYDLGATANYPAHATVGTAIFTPNANRALAAVTNTGNRRMQVLCFGQWRRTGMFMWEASHVEGQQNEFYIVGIIRIARRFSINAALPAATAILGTTYYAAQSASHRPFVPTGFPSAVANGHLRQVGFTGGTSDPPTFARITTPGVQLDADISVIDPNGNANCLIGENFMEIFTLNCGDQLQYEVSHASQVDTITPAGDYAALPATQRGRHGRANYNIRCLPWSIAN